MTLNFDDQYVIIGGIRSETDSQEKNIFCKICEIYYSPKNIKLHNCEMCNELHCVSCGIDYNLIKDIHCHTCKSKYQKKNNFGYFNHCCNCKIQYYSSQNHCCICSISFPKLYEHCCKCKVFWKKQTVSLCTCIH
jgi:hypothetical protein